ncbi:MAG: endonuclease/exonuclease/phosphatase family protein, partial [Acidobacteriota bacterium]
MTHLSIINWNVGGGKLLGLAAEQRRPYREGLNTALAQLCAEHRPDVLCLQEVIRYVGLDGQARDLIVAPPGYHFQFFPILDTGRHSHPTRWNRYRNNGNWMSDDFIGQGQGMLWRDDLPHSALWDFEASRPGPSLRAESIPIETGLFVGDRDTEPRAAVVAHFQYEGDEPRSFFVVNTHLSTLHGEREGNPARDELGYETRMAQLRIILEGIVARHTAWCQLLPDKAGPPAAPPWILAGDLNTSPDSREVARILDFGFRDASPHKGEGNKTSGLGNPPPLVVGGEDVVHGVRG